MALRWLSMVCYRRPFIWYWFGIVEHIIFTIIDVSMQRRMSYHFVRTMRDTTLAITGFRHYLWYRWSICQCRLANWLLPPQTKETVKFRIIEPMCGEAAWPTLLHTEVYTAHISLRAIALTTLQVNKEIWYRLFVICKSRHIYVVEQTNMASISWWINSKKNQHVYYQCFILNFQFSATNMQRLF